MPVIRSTETIEHCVHGAIFKSYVAPRMGSTELCAWQLILPANQIGVAHRPTREEVLFLLKGDLSVAMAGDSNGLSSGDVVFVPADTEVRLDAGPNGAIVWVTSMRGLEAVLPDGSRFVPPWANE